MKNKKNRVAALILAMILAGSVAAIPVAAAETESGTDSAQVVLDGDDGNEYNDGEDDAENGDDIVADENAVGEVVEEIEETEEEAENTNDALGISALCEDEDHRPQKKDCISVTVTDDFTYDGRFHHLIASVKGKVQKGSHVEYRVVDEDGEPGCWVDNPRWIQAKDAGTYTVEYRIVDRCGKAGEVQTAGTVEISKYTVTEDDLKAPQNRGDWTYDGWGRMLIKHHGHIETCLVNSVFHLEYQVVDENGNVVVPWTPHRMDTGVKDAGTYTTYYRLVPDLCQECEADRNFDFSAFEKVEIGTVTVSKAEIDRCAINAPTAKNLYATGEAQELVNSGSVCGYWFENLTMQYKNAGVAEDWSPVIPTAVAISKNYVVDWMVNGGRNYNNFYGTPISVAIKSPLLTAPEAAENLVYNATAQNLLQEAGTVVEPPESEYHYVLKYQVNDGEWSTEVPTATNAGTYKIAYHVDCVETQKTVVTGELTTTIERQKVTITDDNTKLEKIDWTEDGTQKKPAITEILDNNGKVIPATEYEGYVTYGENTTVAQGAQISVDNTKAENANYLITGTLYREITAPAKPDPTKPEKKDDTKKESTEKSPKTGDETDLTALSITLGASAAVAAAAVGTGIILKKRK